MIEGLLFVPVPQAVNSSCAARYPSSIAASVYADAAASAYTDAAIDEGYRAAQELFTAWGTGTKSNPSITQAQRPVPPRQ